MIMIKYIKLVNIELISAKKLAWITTCKKKLSMTESVQATTIMVVDVVKYIWWLRCLLKSENRFIVKF